VSETAPVIYLLYGDDEFAISQFVAELEKKVGDPATATLNISRLEGLSLARQDKLAELLRVAAAMPFLAKRRLVILVNSLADLEPPREPRKNKTQMEAFQAQVEGFKQQMEKIPDTTALVLVENRLLVEWRDRKKGMQHWLESWAETNPERIFHREFLNPHGAAMADWIQKKAEHYGGVFSTQAAQLLARRTDDESRLADQEIQKLLAYVNFKRPVQPEDVQLLTADTAEGDIFAFVDAIGQGDGKQAMSLLQRLLEQQDTVYIFSMIVRQFRLLLLASEVSGKGGNEQDVASVLKLHPFVAGKISLQARRFSLAALEEIYHRLLVLDVEMKSSQLAPELALETFVAEFTRSR
jgi:DNA polymerase-3 subunit delta